METRKILILGGTRFFGPALIAKLRSRMGDAVRLTCFHRGLHLRHDTVPDPGIPLREGPFSGHGFPVREDASSDPRITHIIGDRHSESEVADLFRDFWDMVIDLSGVDERMITLSLQHASRRCGRYVFISSSSVYTVGGSRPHREDEPVLCGTGEPYAAAKILGERLLAEWFPHYTVIRPSKVYGPGNYYFSEMTFLKMIQERRVIALKHDPILHFTYIEDLAEGVCALMEKDGIFNVAGAESASLSRFIQRIADLHALPVSFVMNEESDVPFTGLSDRILDLSAAKEAAGWEPAVRLEEGLKNTFLYLSGASDRPQ